MYFFNEPIIIIADFHLNLYDKRTSQVIKFFDEIVSNYKNIIILGDFFEFYTTFPEVFPEGYFDILYLLKKLSFDKKIFYIEGNHDFNLKDFFNIIVFPEKFDFQFNNKKIVAFHGDTIDKNDKRYRFLRKFLRSSLAKFLMDNLPPYIVLKIAKKLSSSSEKYLRKKEEPEFFKNFFIESAIIKENFDILISGHFHVNDSFKIDKKEIYLLKGIEGNEINYIHLSDEGIEYRVWKF